MLYFVDYFTHINFMYLLWFLMAEKTQHIPLKETFYLLLLKLSEDCNRNVMIFMYYTILLRLWLTARFTRVFYDSLSQVKLSVISVIIKFQSFT